MTAQIEVVLSVPVPAPNEPLPTPPVQPAYYEPFDPEYCRDLLHKVIEPISDHYFRPCIIGAERLPATGPVILAANHSGTAFPYDAIVLDFALWRRDGSRRHRAKSSTMASYGNAVPLWLAARMTGPVAGNL